MSERQGRPASAPARRGSPWAGGANERAAAGAAGGEGAPGPCGWRRGRRGALIPRGRCWLGEAQSLARDRGRDSGRRAALGAGMRRGLRGGGVGGGVGGGRGTS